MTNILIVTLGIIACICLIVLFLGMIIISEEIDG